MKKFLLLFLLLLAPQIVSAGSQTYSTPGTYTFTVPAYGTLTVEVWGGGEGNIVPGNDSSFNGTVIGKGGATDQSYENDVNIWAKGGDAMGGDINTRGANGQYGGYNCNNNGGASPNGGQGGLCRVNQNGDVGAAPGGGGGGTYAYNQSNSCFISGGGAGGYAKKTYSVGQFAPGSAVGVVVGAGANPGGNKLPFMGPLDCNLGNVNTRGGAGGSGQVKITWTDPPTCSLTVDRNPIPRGTGGTTLRWSSTNASTFYITNVGYVSASGSTAVAPLFTRTYAGTVTGAGGSGSCSVRLTVNASCDRNFGNSCTSSANACGQTNTGYIQCNGVCSVTTPPVSSCPAPTCSVSFDSNPAPYGTGTTARWTSANATSFTLATIGPVTPNVAGSAHVAPSSSTSYGGTVYGINGATVSCPATLNVSAPPATTATITSSLGSTVKIGQSSTVTATFTAGSGNTLTADAIDRPAGTHLTSTSVGTKTYTFAPSTAGSYTFYARATTAYSPSWTTYNQVTVTVPPLPTCSVSASPNPITRGQSSTLSWSSTNATSFSLTTIGAVTPNTSGSSSVSPQSTTNYGGTATGAGGSATCPATLTVQCTPAYSCSGQTIQYTNSSCAVSNVTTCVSPAFCSAGSATCLYPPISYPSDGHLSASPSIVSLGTSATVAWSVANISSCTVSGTNGDSWSTTGSAANNYTSTGSYARTINAQTTYTLTCTGLSGTTITESAVVNVLPVFEET